MERAPWQWLLGAVRVGVGLAWVRAGLADLADPLGSLQGAPVLDLLSPGAVEQVAYVVPAVELVVGLALVVGVMARGASFLSATLCLVVAVGLTPRDEAVTLVLLALALALSVLLVRAGPGRLALETLFRRRRPRHVERTLDRPKETVD